MAILNKDFKDFNELLSTNDIANIFSIHLNCPLEDNEEGCDSCILNDARLNGHRIGCFKLRDLAMQKVIDIFGKGDCNGEND